MISQLKALVHTGLRPEYLIHLSSCPPTEDGPDIQLSQEGISHIKHYDQRGKQATGVKKHDSKGKAFFS